MLKNMVSTSKQCLKHPLTGENTQQLSLLELSPIVSVAFYYQVVKRRLPQMSFHRLINGQKTEILIWNNNIKESLSLPIMVAMGGVCAYWNSISSEKGKKLYRMNKKTPEYSKLLIKVQLVNFIWFYSKTNYLSL